MTLVDDHPGILLAVVSIFAIGIMTRVSCGSINAAECDLAPPAVAVFMCFCGIAAGIVIEIMLVLKR